MVKVDNNVLVEVFDGCFFFHGIRFKVSLDTLRSDTRSIFIYIILYHIRYNFGQFVKYITDCLFVYIIEYTEYYINASIRKER